MSVPNYDGLAEELSAEYGEPAIRRQTFKEWFIECHPDCDGYTMKSHQPVWFSKGGEEISDAMLRLGDALSEYLSLRDGSVR